MISKKVNVYFWFKVVDKVIVFRFIKMLGISIFTSTTLLVPLLYLFTSTIIFGLVKAASVDTSFISGNFITGSHSLPLSDDAFIASLSNNKIVRVDFTGTGKSETQTYTAPDVVNYMETLKTGRIMGIYHSSTPQPKLKFFLLNSDLTINIAPKDSTIDTPTLDRGKLHQPAFADDNKLLYSDTRLNWIELNPVGDTLDVIT